MQASWIEVVGYAGSVVVALSLTMGSVLRLRWFNLAGAAILSAYGFLLGAPPVGWLNLYIAAVDAWYLVRMYTDREYLAPLPVEKDHAYLNHFLHVHEADIRRYFPAFDAARLPHLDGFYVLRNAQTAGLFLGRCEPDGVFRIELDYVAPRFRDFAVGRYVFRPGNDFFRRRGCTRATAESTTRAHDRYLLRMGFRLDERRGEVARYSRAVG